MASNWDRTAGQSEEQVKRQSAKRKRQSPIRKLTTEVTEVTEFKEKSGVVFSVVSVLSVVDLFFSAREKR
jgi:hypothetical protein